MRRLSWVAGIVLVVPACVEDAIVPAGQAGGACLQGACFEDLVCDAGVCVDPDGASTGAGADATGGSEGASSGSPSTSDTSEVSSGPTASSGAEASTAPDDSTSGDEPPDTETSEPTSGSSSTTGPDDGSESSDPGSESGMEAVCDPDAGDDACIECTKAQCCDEVEACVADDGAGGCACAHDCVIDGGDFVTCLVGCDLYPPPAGSPVVPLGECMLEQCPSCSV